MFEQKTLALYELHNYIFPAWILFIYYLGYNSIDIFHWFFVTWIVYDHFLAKYHDVI